MAVAYDAGSESAVSTSASSFSWTHTPVGTPKGVVVFVFTISATDKITSVTYDGVTMTRVARAKSIDATGEPGRVDTFFLGSSLPTGAKTVQVNRTNDATEMYAVAVTVTAAGNTEIYGPSLYIRRSDQALAEDQIADGYPGSNSLRLGAAYSGNASVSTTTAANTLAPGANATQVHNHDFGNYVAQVIRETTASEGVKSFGFSAATSDDAAVVSLAVREATATIPPVEVFGVGLETGDFSEYRTTESGHAVDNTTAHAGGAYSHKFTATNTASGQIVRSIGVAPFSNGDDVYLHVAYKIDTTSAPGADYAIILFELANLGGIAMTHRASDGKLGFSASNQGSIIQTPSTQTTITPDTNWHYVEMKLTVGSSGAYEIWHDGTSVATGTAGFLSSTRAHELRVFRNISTTRAGASYWVDDMVVAPWTGARLGELQILARSPVTGTPNADAWTKSSGSDAWSLLNDTPFSATDYISTTSAATAQTMVGGSFASTQSGKGTGTITTGQTVHSAWVAMVSKTSSTTGDGAWLNTRLRYGSTNYDSTTLAAYTTTSDVGLRGAHLTPSASDLASYEVGVASALGAHTRTVEDVWTMAITVVPVATTPSMIFNPSPFHYLVR